MIMRRIIAAKSLILIAVFLVPLQHNNFVRNEYLISHSVLGEKGSWIVSRFVAGDAIYYLHLSKSGYTVRKSSRVGEAAFYPFWPVMVRGAALLTSVDYLVAGLVLSNVFSLAGWGLFYERVRRRWGAAVAGWATGLLILFPGALFFQFPYTESLFFLLVMLLWWGLEERRWGLAWGAAVLLPLTRAVGVFAVLPIAGMLVRERGLGTRFWVGWRRGPGAEASGAWSGGGPVGPPPWGLLAAPVLGWGVYLGLMGYWTGNPFEGFAAQKYWGVHAVGNLVNVPKFVLGFFTPQYWHAFTGSLLDRGVFVLVLYTLPVLWRLDKGLLVWTYWLGILPAMSGTFTSFTRYASCAFPVFVALALWLNGGCGGGSSGRAECSADRSAAGPASVRFWLKWVLVGGFAALHVVLVWRHVNNQWAG